MMIDKTFRFAQRALLFVASVALLTAASGCRKAAVERIPGTSATITPSLDVGDSAYILRPKDASKAPWYREFQVVFDQRPEDEAQLEAYIAQNRAPVVEATNRLLAEIATGVEAQRRPQDHWSLLTAWSGRLKKGGEVSFIADVGLTKMFVRRPGISFQDLPLELAVAKLARESGITDSVPRGYSPRVTWSETDVSVKEAYDAFLPKYGFDRRYQDIQGRVTLRMQDFAFRKDFVASAVSGILGEGKRLNSARGGIVVSPKDTPVVAEPPKKDERAVPVPPDPKK